jgi:enediyne biosynthesis protein E4
VGVALSRGQEPAYRPGEKLEGLTSELSRSLPPDYPHVTFVDVTREAGIQFQHFSGERTSQLPEDMGSGVAWGDYDNDGWPDLFLVNAVGPLTLTPEAARRSPAHCALYRNNHDGTFTDVSVAAGVDARVWGMGAEWGDYDNDGWTDLVVSTYGENLLYHNNGDGTFTDRTRVARLGGVRGFWSGVAWGDYDRDGFLDLYVTGYVRYSRPRASEASAASTDVENPAAINPNVFPPERNLLYHNNRDGTFTEVARAAGVLGERGKSLEAAWADFDEDGWPDLYVANDVTDNQLFRNRHDGTFEDVSHQAHVADYRSAMGLAIGDWDGDQDADMYITHWIAQENALYDNTRNAGLAMDFTDVADRFGLGQISLDFVGWGTFFFDYDNDGRLDLFEANGHTFQRRDAPRLLAPETDQLFWNRNNHEGFYDVSAVSGPHFQEPRVGRGAAFADYDNDGDLDILVMQHGGPAMLLRNDGGNHRRWLNVKVGAGGAGARIRVVVGARTMVREVGAQASYLSQNDPTEHFGLDTTTTVDSLVIVWPDGTRQVSTNLRANQTLTVGKATSTHADIREFWERFRDATRLRIAGSHAAARVAYTRALELNPRHEDALYYLGNTELELGHYREALAAWERLVAVNAGSARAHSRLGDLYLCGDPGAPRDLAKAATEFHRAAEINREETGPLLRLGELALIRSRPGDATRYLDAVIGSHARSVEAHLLKGYVAWQQGQREPATALFHTAVTLAQSAQTVPAIARSSRCRIFEAQLAALATASMNAVYGQLDRRRVELAPH